MQNKNNINLTLLLSFPGQYKRLHEKGEITDQQLEKILSLLDNFEDYSLEQFKEKLEDIFF